MMIQFFLPLDSLTLLLPFSWWWWASSWTEIGQSSRLVIIAFPSIPSIPSIPCSLDLTWSCILSSHLLLMMFIIIYSYACILCLHLTHPVVFPPNDTFPPKIKEKKRKNQRKNETDLMPRFFLTRFHSLVVYYSMLMLLIFYDKRLRKRRDWGNGFHFNQRIMRMTMTMTCLYRLQNEHESEMEEEMEE